MSRISFVFRYKQPFIMSSLDSRYILVSNRQKQNPVVKIIEKSQSVKYESEEDPIFDADFRLGKVTGALFLSISYHKKTPDYIVERMRNISSIRYDIRFLVLLIDISNAEKFMIDLFEICLKYKFTIVPVFDNEHAANVLLEIKHDRDSFIVQPQAKESITTNNSVSSSKSSSKSSGSKNIEQHETTLQTEMRQVLEQAFQASKSRVNTTDVANLCSLYEYDFEKLATACLKPKNPEIGGIEGFGATKVARLESLFKQPFSAD